VSFLERKRLILSAPWEDVSEDSNIGTKVRRSVKGTGIESVLEYFHEVI
jgi:hypothetical protein